MDSNNYEFLKGFEGRMNLIGSISSFIIKLVNSQRFKELINQQELINLSVAVLCYLLEKTLTKEGVTLIEVRDFINWSFKECYDKEISTEESLELARFLIRDVFMNSGEYYIFQVFNYKEKAFIPKNFQLVRDKIDSEGNLRYYLSDLGNDFLIRTKEIDQHLHISMQQIIAKEFIKRKDFKNANVVAKDLLVALNREKQVIESFLDRVRTSDILTLDIEEYKARLKSIFDTLESQRVELEAIISLVEQSEHEFLELGSYDEKLEELKAVKDTLNKIRREHIGLLGERFVIDEAYEEALVNAMSVGLEKRFDFKETIINPIGDNPELLSKVGVLLRPLLKVHMPKYYNIFQAYGEQQMLKPEAKLKVEGLDLTIDKELIEEKKRLKEERYNKHLGALKFLLDICMKYSGEEVDLLTVINEMNMKERLYFIDEDEDRVFFKVITFLFTGRTLYLKELLEKENKQDENLTVPGLFKDLCEGNEKYKSLISLNVYKDFDSKELTVYGETQRSKKDKEYEVDRIYTITNYKFKVVCM